MDFIERIFHIAPDGGNGLTEAAILLACAFVAAGAVWLGSRVYQRLSATERVQPRRRP
ncbi:MAG TPA: hypothetical protein VML19_35880 [Verrucomicrobiae bacterium]|nr:hypothetical protein [Verrucomicrobiae bacterium]